MEREDKLVKKRFSIVLAVFASFLLACAQVHALNLSEIRNQIRIAVRDNPSDTSRYRYSDSTLLNWINEGQRECVNATWLAEKSTSYVLTAQTSYYNLPTNFLAMTQAYFRETSNQIIELEEYSQKALYDTQPDWEKQAGSPAYYWVSQATNPSASNLTTQRVSFIPVPTLTSTGTVILWFNHQVADLSSDSDVPFDGRRQLTTYHAAIVFYVVYRIKLIEGKTDEAAFYQKLYENEIVVAKDKIGRSPNYTPGMSGGGRR